MAHIDIVLWCFHSYPTRTIVISNIHLPYHPKIWPKDRHPSLHIQINIPGMDVKGILWTSQRKPPQQSCKMVGLDTQQQRGITTLPIHQRGLKQHSRLDIYVISHIRLISHPDFHIPPPTTDSYVVPHQTYSHINYFPYICFKHSPWHDQRSTQIHCIQAMWQLD